MIYTYKNLLLVLVMICAFALEGFSQLGKRLTLGTYAGMAKGMGTEIFSQNGSSQNIFAGFHGGGLAGLNLMYGKSKFIELGGNIHGLSISKGKSKLNLLAVGPQIQLNLLASDKNIIPYLAGSVNVSFLEYKQSGYNTTTNPPDSYSTGSSANIPVSSIQIQNPSVNIGVNAALGYKLNAGVNIKLGTKVFSFIEAGYNTVITNSNSNVKNVSPDSKGNLSYLSVLAGIKINLLKSRGLY